MSPSIAKFIDHTLLSPTATNSDIERLCRDILLAVVVGFPHGNASTEAKTGEAASYAASGADELDVVLNTGWAKSGEWAQISRELTQIRECAPDKTLKLILETCYLEDSEKRKICRMALESGWDFVKTSTGFGPAGATLPDIRLMKDAVGDAMGIKASGGIRARSSRDPATQTALKPKSLASRQRRSISELVAVGLSRVWSMNFAMDGDIEMRVIQSKGINIRAAAWVSLPPSFIIPS
ncbi:MAG: deoxyribose-phosphate aldolase [Robiginitalea sp.]